MNLDLELDAAIELLRADDVLPIDLVYRLIDQGIDVAQLEETYRP